MAKNENEESKETGEEVESQPKPKKGIFMGGGLIGLIALAYVLSLVALPKNSGKAPPFQGPFIAVPLINGDVQVNMAKVGGKRFLVLNFTVEFDGYDQVYADTRIADPLFQASMIDALIRLGRKKTMEDVEDEVGVEVFSAEIRDALDPLLFPVHVGNETSSTAAHSDSGLKPGRSNHRATMRHGYRSHKVILNAMNKTIALDMGPEKSFDGSEEDLKLENERGFCVYVDVTEVDPEFVGEVNVGTFGQLNDIFFNRLLTQ